MAAFVVFVSLASPGLGAVSFGLLCLLASGLTKSCVGPAVRYKNFHLAPHAGFIALTCFCD